MQSTRLVRCMIRATAVLVACSCAAQVMQNRGALPGGGQYRFPGQGTRPEIPAATPQIPQATSSSAKTAPGATAAAGAADTAKTAPAAPPPLPPSLLDRPAHPAKVILSGGKLSVEADNSSLSQILDVVETASGMTVDGLGKKDQRVFGRYGPGTPRDVLSELLDGAGYNFMMVGTTDSGAPRSIILTESGNAPAATMQASSEPEQQEEEQPAVNNYPPPPPPAGPRPSVLPPPDASGRVRTPQEILQELERMRAQQAQQQQPPQ